MKLIYGKTNRFYIGKIVLTEGENEIANEEWDVIKNHPQVKGYIKDGVISVKEDVISEKEDKDADENVDSEEQKNSKEQVVYVSEITDIEKLEELLETEERKTVIKAIKKQIAALEKINGEVNGDKEEE